MAHSLTHPDSGSLFQRCLVGSAVFHIGLLLLGGLSLSFKMMAPSEGLVIDLTLPLRDYDSPGMGPVDLPPTAPPLAVPVSAPIVPTPPIIEKAPAPAPVAQPEPEVIPISAEVVEPEPVSAAVVEPPAVVPVQAVVPSPAVVSSPIGAVGGEGTTPGASTLGPEGGGGTRPAGRTANPEVMPSLLNKEEVLRNLRRFYPEAERLAGREAKVIVKVFIGISGNVEKVTILRSGGNAFDAGAKAVAKRMRFSPAIWGGHPVAVALPQVILFQLN